MEKEDELIDKYRSIEELIENFKVELIYRKPEKQLQISEKIFELSKQKELIKEQLINIAHKPATINKIEQVRKVLILIINHLELNASGNHLSKAQGTIEENMIFGKIMSDIKSALLDYSYHIPNYYYEIGGKFDHTELKETLVESLKQYNQTTFNNYIELEKYIDDLLINIRQLALKDYKKN